MPRFINQYRSVFNVSPRLVTVASLKYPRSEVSLMTLVLSRQATPRVRELNMHRALNTNILHTAHSSTQHISGHIIMDWRTSNMSDSSLISCLPAAW